MFENAKWIIHQDNKQYEAISFKKELNLSKKVKKATKSLVVLQLEQLQQQMRNIGQN
jgi:hypothetical protein